MNRASRRSAAVVRLKAIGDFQLRNPACLHCVVVDLVNYWIDYGRDEPQDALMKLAEAIGTLVAEIRDPEERHAARQGLAEMILEVSERVMGNA